MSLSALKGLSVKLGALREGRKAIILRQRGLHGDAAAADARRHRRRCPGSATRARGNPLAGENNLNEDRARSMAELDLQPELQQVFDAANRNNTSIYAVDPRGLSTGEFDITDNIGIRQSQDVAALDAWTRCGRWPRTPTAAPSSIATTWRTGMKQIIRDSSAYYLLGYNSTQAPQDGKFHEIKVRVKRPGVQVRARKGYWALHRGRRRAGRPRRRRPARRRR